MWISAYYKEHETWKSKLFVKPLPTVLKWCSFKSFIVITTDPLLLPDIDLRVQKSSIILLLLNLSLLPSFFTTYYDTQWIQYSPGHHKFSFAIDWLVFLWIVGLCNSFVHLKSANIERLKMDAHEFWVHIHAKVLQDWVILGFWWRHKSVRR